MEISFLDGLDAITALGVTPLSAKFLQLHGDYVHSRQQPDGGFPARHGTSDIYYTDFALRTLKICGDVRTVEGARGFCQQSFGIDIVTAFCQMNCARMLGDSIPDLSAIIDRQRIAGGGYARLGNTQVSAYETFLAVLCYEIIGAKVPCAVDIPGAVKRLHCVDGGYSELSGAGVGQTNATAAATAALLRCGVADTNSTKFLLNMQAADGGLMAHAGVGEGDLLSTYTGVLTLFNLDALGKLDLPAVGKFVRELALPAGGFRSSLRDSEADIEYTYYGIGTLAILRAYLMAVA